MKGGFMFIKHLFRAERDVGPISFTATHLITLVLFLAYFVLLFMFFSKKKKNPVLERKLDTGLHSVVFSVIVLLYSWYILVGDIKDSLPLYHCRLSMILLCVIYVLRRFGSLKFQGLIEQWTVTMAMEGAWMAVIMPTPDKFGFLHITNYTYFVGHFALLAIALFYISNWQKKPSFSDFLRLLLIMLAYNVFLFAFDLIFKENYGFFVDVPGFEWLFEKMPILLKFLILNLGHQAVFGVFWLANRLIWTRLHRK